MKIKFILILSAIALMNLSCNDKETPTITNQSQPVDPNLEQLKTEASRLRNGGSVKSIELKNGKAIITYVKDYTEYKQLQPQSKLTENDLKEYWSTGNAIQKILVEGPVQIMKKLSFIDEVELILPFQGKIYRSDVKKTELEKFIGKDFSEITNTWTESFVNPYVYNKNGRQKFLNKFSVEK